VNRDGRQVTRKVVTDEMEKELRNKQVARHVDAIRPLVQ
jgi:hypothetical protein